MDNKYIVRADFYPDGSIIPICFTDKSGNTMWVQKMQKKSFLGSHAIQYECTANQKKATLLFDNNNWTIIIHES